MIRIWVHEFRTLLEGSECRRRLLDPTLHRGVIIHLRESDDRNSTFSVTIAQPFQLRRYADLLLDIQAMEQRTVVRLRAYLPRSRIVFGFVWTVIVIPFVVIAADPVVKLIFTSFWLAPLVMVLGVAVRHSSRAEGRILALLDASRSS